MNKRQYPEWVLPKLSTVGLDYRSVRGILGGQARARNLTPERLRRIAMKGYKAYLAKLTPEERRERASQAARIGNAKRWAGHAKKERRQRLTKEERAAINRINGAKGIESRWGAKPI